MTNDGWIKLYRKLLDSDMYMALNSKQRDVMFVCLMLANHRTKRWEWHGKIYKCKPGQFITSLENLAKKCASDVKVKSVRTAISKLERWDFLASEGASQGRLITICNWETYQLNEEPTGKPTGKRWANDGQTMGKRRATNKNDKEYKEETTIDIDINARAEKSSCAKFENRFTEPYSQALILWQTKREAAGLKFLADPQTKDGASMFADMANSGEATVEDLESAIDNLLADSEARSKYTLKGLVKNLSSWIERKNDDKKHGKFNAKGIEASKGDSKFDGHPFA